MGLYGLAARVGRRRRAAPTVVTVVVAGEDVRLAPDSPLARAMSEVAALLAHW